MESLGDLANELARMLYELRIPLAILSIALTIGLVLFARRLGWFAAARRHPGRTTTLILVGLLVAAPVGWYLGSPIFIRTSLVEAAPIPTGQSGELSLVPAPTPSVASPTAVSPVAPSAIPSSPAISAPVSTSSPTPFVPTAIASGEFAGTDDFHFGRGTASIIETAPGQYHLRLEDFSVRNGPDLYVYLSPSADGYEDDALEVGLLKATDGSFGYDLPAGTDPTDFSSAIIWCKQFSHLFAVAPFEG
jgi:hypothetical protein